MNSRTGPEASGSAAPEAVRWRILAVLLVAIFMSLVGVSIVNVALPSIQHGLGASEADLQWVLSGYALTFGVVLVAAGRTGDLVGRGGIFILGVTIFTLSSVAAGLAPGPDWLNGARFVQGLGSGLLNPQGVGMIQQYFRGAERGRAFGFFGSVVGIAVGLGPVLGGFLVDIGDVDFGWRLTFLVNVPIGLLTIGLALAWFPRPLIRPLPREGGAGRWAAVKSLDPVGSLLIGVAVLAVLIPFVEARTEPWLWLALPAGLLLVVAWLFWERGYARRGHSPMVDLGIFSTRSFTNGTAVVTLYFLGITSIWVLVALYLQEGMGRTALESGLVAVPAALLAALAADWAGRRVVRIGRPVVIGGLLFGVAGMALSVVVVLLNGAGLASEWWLIASLALVGIAQGSVISPNQTLTLQEVPLSYAGSSGAIMQTGQRIGSSVGIAVVTAAVFAVLPSTSWPTATAVGFGLIGLVMLGALAVAFKDLRDRGRGIAPRPGEEAGATGPVRPRP